MLLSFFNPVLRNPRLLGPVALAAVTVAGYGIFLALRKKPTPDEMERSRRDYLLQVGRILDGTVLDITEVEQAPALADGPRIRRHIFYQYEIAGVSYECSQDVTMLQSQAAGATSTPGMPTSVRYDPHNPSNSIVLAETWTGLHRNNDIGGTIGTRRNRAQMQANAQAAQPTS